MASEPAVGAAPNEHASPDADAGAEVACRDLAARYRLRLEYDCDRARLGEQLSRAFHSLRPDAALAAYLKRAPARRAGVLGSALHSLCVRLMSDFDANALLDMYRMHLLSREQWRAVLGDAPRRRLLDVGAGSGDITQELLPLFESVRTSERSRGMARRLRRMGFDCDEVDIAESGVPDGDYDVITCLNVIDRTPRPHSLLSALSRALAPGALLVLAVPLPYQPHYYDGPLTHDPEERLPIRGNDWESAVRDCARAVLSPLGLAVRGLCRAPYLSSGDRQRAVYELDDAIFVCTTT